MVTRDEIRRLPRSGKLLVERGVVDESTLERALDLQTAENGRHRRLAEILVDDLGLDRHSIYRELALLYAFRDVDLEAEELTEEKAQAIKSLYETLEKDEREALLAHSILPYPMDESQPDTLLVLMDDPTNRDLRALGRRFHARHVEFGYARREALRAWIEKIFPLTNEFLQIVQEAAGKIESIDEEQAQEALDEEKLEQEIHKSLLISLIEGCLIEAVRRDASDIHVVPAEGNRTDFHFRIDGKLQLWHTQEFAKPEAIAAVVKDRSRNVDRFERESAQDGFIQRNVDDHLIRYRVSILPIVHAEFRRKLESIVIRVLDDRKVITDLEKLGLQLQAKDDFTRAIRKPQGMVILTGPTGSGKSTTLMAALHHVMSPQLNVLTVEDPVEYMIRGARQIKIGPHLDFDGAMRSILRHDPDIVMVGEIRDKTTAEIAIKLANTGHLTFSTLHTNDAPSAISRLFKMGVEPFLIAYAINLVLAQRLVRTLCPRCKAVDADLDPVIPRALGFTEAEIRTTTFYRPVGCDQCLRGYRGRIAICESLLFSRQIRRIVLESGAEVDEDAVRNEALKNGMLTLRASGRERIKEGVTTCEEIAFATAED